MGFHPLQDLVVQFETFVGKELLRDMENIYSTVVPRRTRRAATRGTLIVIPTRVTSRAVPSLSDINDSPERPPPQITRNCLALDAFYPSFGTGYLNPTLRASLAERLMGASSRFSRHRRVVRFQSSF